MASVKYHGEFPEGQDSIVHMGETFEKGKAVNVTDKATLEKLAANRFFEVSGASDKQAVEQGQTEAEEAETATLRAYLDENKVPYRANASLANLQKARADYDAQVAKAQEA